MTRDEVMALTDEQLRIKAAESMGYEKVGHDQCFGDIAGYLPEADEDRGEGWMIVPDYLNDIAAAWELWRKLEADGFIVSLENGTHGRGAPIIGVHGTGGNKDFDAVFKGDEKKIITRAFILAMEPS